MSGAELLAAVSRALHPATRAGDVALMRLADEIEARVHPLPETFTPTSEAEWAEVYASEVQRVVPPPVEVERRDDPAAYYREVMLAEPGLSH